jgi:hypothetical protein
MVFLYGRAGRVTTLFGGFRPGQSCPTNLGTGMRASLHIALPNLTADGTDAKVRTALSDYTSNEVQ